MSVKISPSILASDFSSLGDEVVNITQAGADYIHVDVMDGHFVPNLTIGPDVVKSIRDKSSLPFDVHLMIDPVQPYIEKFVEAGADIVSVHPEANDDTEACLNKIKSLNVKAGLAINPDTEWEVVKPFMDKLDLILVMSVHPGFGGQKFIPTALDKLSNLREEINKSGREIHLEVDGGINFENVQSVIDAGADMIVAGTTTFKGGPSEYANLKKIRLYRETPDENGQLVYFIDLTPFLEKGDRSNFPKIKHNDTIVMRKTFTGVLIEDLITVQTLLAALTFFIQLSTIFDLI